MKLLDLPPSPNTPMTSPAWQSWFNFLRRAVTQGLGVSKGSITLGQVTLAAGTATVLTPAVTASSLVMLSRVASTNPGFMNAGTRVVGTSFTINSSSTTDASVVAWVIIEPL